MPTKIPSPRPQSPKYRPFVEALEAREAPGNSALGPVGFMDPAFLMGSAGALAVSGSSMGSTAGSGAVGSGGSMYQGYSIGGAGTGGSSAFADAFAAVAAAAGSAGSSGSNFYVGGGAAGSSAASASDAGTSGAGFGGGSIAGSGMQGWAGLVGNSGHAGDNGAALANAVMNQTNSGPASANAPTAFTNAYIEAAESTDMFWAVKLKDGVDAGVFAASKGGVNYGMGGVTAFSNIYMIKFAEGANAASVQAALQADSRVVWADQQVRDNMATNNAAPNDPFFRFQWHLKNTAEFGGLPGADANVLPAWDTVQGRGVTIGIVDSGVEYTHEDLAANYDFAGSFDFTEGDTDAWPRDDDDGRSHGTSVAGVAAARGGNGIGVSGAAPLAQIAGLKLIDGTGISDYQIAASQSFNKNVTDIYNNSWGKADPEAIIGFSALLRATFEENARFGRGGLGNVTVWSAGNSHAEGSEANYDARKNNQWAIDVGSLTESGTKSGYSEEGANVFVSAYSNGGNLGIVTTGTENGYVGDFGGTSSAAPLVSGVIALVLEANPNLTWRDVKAIIAKSSRKTDAQDSSWVTNGAGLHHSNKYGFGAIDAGAAVELARTWTNLPSAVNTFETDSMVVGLTIPESNPLSRTFNIPQNFVVEHVEVIFTAVHASLGQIAMDLTSPSGTRMNVGPLTANEEEGAYVNQPFGFVGFMGEQSQGSWTLRVRDVGNSGDGVQSGQWIRWQLRVHGYQPNGGVVPPPPGPGGGSDGSQDSRYEPNNSQTRAFNLGALAGASMTVEDIGIATRTDRDWFKLTTTRSGNLTAQIDITGNAILHVKLYTFDARTRRLVEVGRNQGTKIQPGGQQSVVWNVGTNQTVFVQVLGYKQARGAYNLTLSQVTA